MQVRMSWLEHFLNWYPRNTRLYRRQSKADDAKSYLDAMKIEGEELRPFFAPIERMQNERDRYAAALGEIANTDTSGLRWDPQVMKETAQAALTKGAKT